MSKKLLYSDSVDDLRRLLLRIADAAQDKADRLADIRDLDKIGLSALNANGQVVCYASTLSALLGWIGRECGVDVQHKAAWLVDDMLINGDDTDLNEGLLDEEVSA